MIGNPNQREVQLEFSLKIKQKCNELLSEGNFAGIIGGESFTGGGVLSALTAVPGASKYILGGVVFYQKELKAKLGLDNLNPVSAQFAEKSAKGLLSYSKIEFGILPSVAFTTTGFAGPSGEEGLFFIGMASSAGTESHQFKISAEGNDIERRKYIRGQGVIETLRLVHAQLSV